MRPKDYQPGFYVRLFSVMRHDSIDLNRIKKRCSKTRKEFCPFEIDRYGYQSHSILKSVF